MAVTENYRTVSNRKRDGEMLFDQQHTDPKTGCASRLELIRAVNTGSVAPPGD